MASVASVLAAMLILGANAVEFEPSSEFVSDSAAADAVELTWRAPASCPDETVVRQALADYLGQGLSADAGTLVRAIADVQDAEDGMLHLSLQIETATGVNSRESSSDDCAVLVDATALIVAIAVDPSQVVGQVAKRRGPKFESERASEPELEPEPVPIQAPSDELSRRNESPVRSAHRPQVRQTVTERRFRVGMRMGAGLDGGTLPSLTGGVRLSISMLASRWRAELFGDYWVPRNVQVEPGIGARIGYWAAGARGCGVPRLEALSLEFPLCVGLEAGIFRGDPSGERVINAGLSRQLWSASHARAGLAWLLRRFIALYIAADLVVPFRRVGFRVGEIEVHRVGPVSGRGVVGLEARFP